VLPLVTYSKCRLGRRISEAVKKRFAPSDGVVKAIVGALASASLVLVAGCGGESTLVADPNRPPRHESPARGSSVAPHPDDAERLVRAAEAKPQPARVAACEVKALTGGRRAYGAAVRRATRAFAAPTGRLLARLDVRNENGVPMVLGVLAVADCKERWYRVQLPMRPNGLVGWVRAADVRLRRVRTRIVVDLGDRTVTMHRDGRRLIHAIAAVGAPDTPTPTGRYYVNQRLVAPDASGPFGPGAVGVSAFSPVLQHWIQGGPIAIHGTNQPHLLGQAVSHGCVRIRNDVLVRLYRLADEGTPVEIRA
jgi:lipoprotein-anchoring transpeptidase ErfK/SrfK